MGVNWGNALAGGGIGLLGGYSQMLGMKMKEDFDLKMEEVKGERQMNLQKQSQEYMKPYHDAEVTNRDRQLNITENHYKNTEANQKLQIEESARARREAAGAAAQARRDALDEQKKMHDGTYDIAKAEKMDEYTATKTKEFADRIYNFTLKQEGGTPEDAALNRGIVETYQITNAKDWAAINSNKDQVATLNDAKLETVKFTQKQLAEYDAMGKDGQDKKIQDATNAGWKEKEMDVDSFFYKKNMQTVIGAMGVGQKRRGNSENNQAASAEVVDPDKVAFLIASEEDSNKRAEIWRRVNQLPPNQVAEINKAYEQGTKPGLLRGSPYNRRSGAYNNTDDEPGLFNPLGKPWKK